MKAIERKIKTDYDKNQLITFLSQKAVGFTVEIKDGIDDRRSTAQNKLQRLWVNEAGEQGDMTAEEYRAFCKLHFGVPMLRNENEKFRESYDRVVKKLGYEAKLEIMAEPLSLPVTRLMNKSQKTRYLNMMYQHFIELGFDITDPQDLIYEQT